MDESFRRLIAFRLSHQGGRARPCARCATAGLRAEGPARPP